MKKRVLSFLLALVMVLSCVLQIIPVQTVRAVAADPVVVTDPGTADAWEDIMGTDADGSRYAGRVWVDKSVYTDGDTVVLNQQGNADSTFVADVDTDNGEYFQVVFSALGSSMSTNTSTYATRPLDVVIVLDSSGSMRTTSSGSTRMQHMIEAANELLDDLLELGDVRVAIVSYNEDSETIIGLNQYENGVNLSVNSYTNSNGGGVITARDDSGTRLGNDSGYQSGTNLQDGIHRGMDILANATDTEGRTPIAIVLTDGRANHAVSSQWYSPSAANRRDSGDAGILLSTLLNAAYGKTRVERNYNADMTVYGIGIDLSSSSDDYIFLNPGAEGSSGFNASNNNNDVRTAWNAFVTWRAGNTATMRIGNRTWTFDHNWPRTANVTTAEIAANINYVDNYQDVAGADLGDAFDSIYQELSTGAFNPITDTNNGATGVENTPLIYSDHIGQYMQVKSVQAIQVFGTVYEVTERNGVYTVAAGSGVNPTTDENWNTGDIHINVMENTDGTQELRVYIEQEILPILLDEISVTTEGGVTTRTLDVTEYPPLRVFYTLGIDEDVLLPNGQVDLTKIDPDYAHVNEDGTVDFYANAFNEMNSEDSDGNGLVDRGDAHVGFVPSHANRFYYHQAHQEIFISATNKNGSAIDWDDDMYGVVWEEDKYELEALTYADYADMDDSDRVYTYVTFHRPTGRGNAAEEVTYLVYTTWGDLKSAATFYDKVNEAALNGGAAIDTDQVDSVVSAYKSGKNITNDDLIAVLGIQSRRVSRLHNMFEYKDTNDTQTADLAYAPAYNDGANDDSDVHEHSEVIVWLGNNGKLTLPIGTGLKVTKTVTEVAEGASADEKFAISVLLDMDYSANAVAGLTIVDADGDAITDYTATGSNGDILVTVNLADGESAYILGLPGGMDYTVTEADNENYTYTYTGDTKTVAGAITAGVVTNEPVRAGALYITKEVVHAQGGEHFPTDQEFTFQVTFLDKNGQPIANTEFELENNYEPNLTALSTDENGVMTGWLRHGETVYIKDIPAGATVTVEEVQIPENYTSTTYRSRNHSGAEADNDGIVTIDPGQNATVVVTNAYTPDEVSVDISFDGTKNFDATNMTEDSEFTFKLQEYVNGGWTDVEGEVVTITGGTNASEGFAFDALHLEFEKAGIHSYQIVEALGDNSDITYDRSVYTFSVNVTVDSNGDLEVEVVGYNQKEGFFEVAGDAANGYLVTTVFNNQYHTTATSVEVVKSVDDNAGTGKTAAGFVIETYEASVDGEGNWTQGDFIRSTVTDAEGEALLVRNYDNTDFEVNDTDGDNVVTYHFIIKEKDTGAAGWTYDTTEYRLTVVLTKDDAGAITAEFEVEASNGSTPVVSGDTAKITFANKYDPDDAKVSLSTLVKKELEGRELKAGEFEFAIYENGETSDPVATGTNAADGTVTFEPGELTFSKVGKYEYDIAEIKNDLGGVTYDSIIYDLVVEVVDNGDGTLKATYYFEDSVDTTVTFKNTYTVKGTEVVIDGIKTLTVVSGSKALAAGDYTFYLYDDEGVQIGETTNLANGTFKFDAISYTGADIGKTFTYTVKEKNAGSTIGGVTYSNKEFTVTVKVTDNGDGTIKAEVTGNGRDNIYFENKYESKLAEVILPAKKNLENRDLRRGEFTFALYQTDRNFANPVLVRDTITHDDEGNFSVNIQDLNVGTYYYVLQEVIPEVREPGIHYSGAQFNITVVVTDSGNGQMTATKTVVNPGDEGSSDIVFNNLYRPYPDQIDLSGTKTYNGGKALEDDVFSVGLYDIDGELLQTAFVKADGSFTFEDLVYTADDIDQVYTYTVEEIIPEGATDNGDGTMTSGSNIYDASVLTVTVTVKDDVKDGALEITKTVTKNGTSAELSFTNTFIPDPITHVITAKKTYEKGLQGEDFRFTLTSADDKTDVDETVKNDAEGIVEFSPVTLPTTGEYKFTVVEKTDGLLAFIRPSEAEYEVTLVVENVNGVLVVTDTIVVNTKNTTESNLEFVNTYIIDGEDEITLSGTKVLTGDRTTVEEGEFEFGLYDAAGTEIEKVAVDANGNFQFATLHFDEVGVPVNGSKEITYTVKEIPGTDPLIDYDDTVYTVVVTVKDNDEGGVTASYTVNGDAEGEIVFTNTYTAPEPVQAVIKILKTVTNKTNEGIGPEDFTFILAADGQTLATDVSDEEGNAGFVIKLDISHLGQTFEYTLSEEKGTKKGVTYDKTVYDVKITVAQNEDGSLKTIINDVETDSVSYEFNNSYKKPGVPDTGDEAKLLLLGLLAVVGVTGLCATAMFAFRKKEER